MNLEERRAWMQAGRPVDEVKAPAPELIPEPGEHRAFFLYVSPKLGRLAAKCAGCRVVHDVGGMTVSHNGPGVQVLGIHEALSGLCMEMGRHGDGLAGEVADILQPEHEARHEIKLWATALMMDRDERMPPRTPPPPVRSSDWQFSFNTSPIEGLRFPGRPAAEPEPLKVGVKIPPFMSGGSESAMEDMHEKLAQALAEHEEKEFLRPPTVVQQTMTIETQPRGFIGRMWDRLRGARP